MKIKKENLEIKVKDLKQLLGENFALISIRAAYIYNENRHKTDKIKGYYFDVVLLDKSYEKISVLIEEELKDNFKNLDNNLLKQGISVIFKGLEVNSIFAIANNNFITYEAYFKAKDILIKNGNN